MKIFLSPAKLMADSVEHSLNLNEPTYLKQAEQIMRHLSKKKVKDLQDLMKISEEIALMNVERNTNWKAEISSKHIPALYAFKGEVYRGLKAEELKQDAVEYLQNHLYILSGLYGLLKPMDGILPYRLEMGSRFSFLKYKNLYEFWRPKLNEQINSELGEEDWILNLASEEYFKATDRKKLKAKVVNVEFLNNVKGTYKKVMVYFKQGRGAMARYCAENQVETVDQLKDFNDYNYRINDLKSTENHLVFEAG